MASTVPSAAPSSKDLLVVGPGVLGGYLGKIWKEEHPGSSVTGLTNTDANHARLKNFGFEPHVRQDVATLQKKFPYVVFSAPPTHSEDYAADVKEAMSLWDGSGSFVFTSSMSVCSVDDGSAVQESCPLVAMGAMPNTDKLLAAEEATLQGGGNVVRLVGLYHSNRGPHTFFLKMGELARYGGYSINMMHYEDATRMTMSILKGEGSGPFRAQIFLGCDNHPITFTEMIKHCNNSGRSELSGEVKFTLPEAEVGDKGKGKRCDNTISRSVLGGWRPKFDSFQAFMEAGAEDVYRSLE